MAKPDRGSQPNIKEGAEPPQKATGATKPGDPKQPTKPAPKRNVDVQVKPHIHPRQP